MVARGTVRHLRSRSQTPAPSVALAGTRGTLAAIGPPVNGGLSNSIGQGQAQRDVGVDEQEEGQRPSTEVEYHGGPHSEVFDPPESVEQQRATTEVDCHDGPVPEVSEPPEATASLARGRLPLQARHQRRLQPSRGTLSPPTAVISDAAFEEWLQSDNMEMPMFSQSEGPQQSAPTAVCMYVCMVITYSRVWINRVRLPILLVVS